MEQKFPPVFHPGMINPTEPIEKYEKAIQQMREWLSKIYPSSKVDRALKIDKAIKNYHHHGKLSEVDADPDDEEKFASVAAEYAKGKIIAKIIKNNNLIYHEDLNLLPTHCDVNMGKNTFGVSFTSPDRGGALDLTAKIWTFTNTYRIIAHIYLNSDNTYLGCTASCRKSRTGETWTRGNDLPDGKFNQETWDKIMVGIVKYETEEVKSDKWKKGGGNIF